MFDSEKVRVLQIKQCRRDLLKALNMAYPGGLSFEDCCAVLPTTDKHYIGRDLQYFLDAEYVQIINEQRNMASKDRRFKLTRKGVDVADKINVDAALEP